VLRACPTSSSGSPTAQRANTELVDNHDQLDGILLGVLGSEALARLEDADRRVSRPLLIAVSALRLPAWPELFRGLWWLVLPRRDSGRPS
jgi:hypothetical protein